MKQKQLWLSLVVSIAVCLLVEMIGGFFTRETVSTWYPQLVKPSWTPPDWLFGPVWTCLYIMIGLSGWLIYRAEYSEERAAVLRVYAIQLVLNFLWSFLFFTLRSPILGLVDIVLLLVFIYLTIVRAWFVCRIASVLLVPYLIWVMYATSLNIGIWWLNR